jgi:hypothetical protein
LLDYPDHPHGKGSVDTHPNGWGLLFDPTRRVWGTPMTRRIATIPDPAAPSDAMTATLPRWSGLGPFTRPLQSAPKLP